MRQRIRFEKLEKTQFRSNLYESLKIAVLFGIAAGCLFGVLSYSVFQLIADAPGHFFIIWLQYPLCWPVSILTCVLFALLISWLCAVHITVNPKQVEVWQYGRRKIYSLNVYAFYNRVERKEKIIEIFKYTQMKTFLEIQGDGGQHITYRLYGFSENMVSQLMSSLKAVQVAAVPIEERVEAREQILPIGNERGIYIDREAVIHREGKRLKKTLGLYLLLMFMLLLVPFALEGSVWSTMKVLVLFLAMLLMVIEFPVELWRFRRARKHCPDYITYMEQYLKVGETHYSMGEILEVRITDPSRKSSSILPVQRYLKIKTGSGWKTYWLGSERTLEQEIYLGIYRILREAFLYTPEKLRF